jgi:hypothetical protein
MPDLFGQPLRYADLGPRERARRLYEDADAMPAGPERDAAYRAAAKAQAQAEAAEAVALSCAERTKKAT